MKLFKKFGIILSLVLLLGGVFSVNNSAEAADYPISSWQYHMTVKSSTVAEKITVLAGSLLVSNYVLAPWTGAKTLVQFAAGVYTITRGQNLWTTTKVYRKFAETGQYFKPVAAEQDRISYYIDSSRTKKAGAKTVTHYTSWY
jgi:hypothetical protein